jgi:hypothetical protein
MLASVPATVQENYDEQTRLQAARMNKGCTILDAVTTRVTVIADRGQLAAAFFPKHER